MTYRTKHVANFTVAICFILSAAANDTRAQTNDKVNFDESPVFDIRKSGAIGDGTTVNTKAVQSAIDQASAAGGGTVLIAGGKYVTGTIYLKSNIILRVAEGAVLLGSPNIEDYTTDTDRTMYVGEPYMDRCLIFAKDVTNVWFVGPGTIDGQGKSFPNKGDGRKNRPKMIRIMNSSQIRMRDITLMAPASWTTEWRYCDDIAVDGITIFSRANSNGDGLDFDGCTRVRVSRSSFDTSDDSICLQTSLTDKPVRDVVVTSCRFSSRWAGIRIGLLSRGNIEDVTVTDCLFQDHNESGLKIQMNEGAEMNNFTFSNLTMKNVPRPVFLTFCQQNAWVDAPRGVYPPMKRVRNIAFNNITVETTAGKNVGFVITGMPGYPLENISFTDIKGTFAGGGTEADAKTILKELTHENLIDDQGRNRWPEMGLLRGTMPAHGIYARHIKGLTLKNIRFETLKPDARPAITLVDASDVKHTDSPTPVVQTLTAEEQDAAMKNPNANSRRPGSRPTTAPGQ